MYALKKMAAVFILCFTCGALSAGDAVKKADLIQPLIIGSQVPAVTLKTPEGTNLNLAEVVSNKPTVLIFYRGSW